MRTVNIFLGRFIFFVAMGLLFSCTDHADDYADWPVTRGSKKSINYSGLKQIDTSNVKDLEVAWIYHSENNDPENLGVIECNPIIIEGILYGVSPKMKLFALKADTGEEIWKFDPADSIANPKWHLRRVNMNRGVTYWADGEDKRIIYTVGPMVFAVDATSGKLVKEFGDEGGVDLRLGLDRNPEGLFVAPTSAVMIYKDLFFVSGLVSDNTPGHIRGFDVRTGAQKWIFHTIPHPGEYGYETWEDTTAYLKMGSTNSWAGFSLDEKRGILYAPTGNPTNDFYGGRRLGDGLFGNCIIALNAETGERIWHYQTVRHDVWDMDVSSAPGLATITRDGKKIDVVVQTTKTGLIFVLDRETGEPVFPIEEKKVATEEAAQGEKLNATQPIPVLPKAFSRQTLTKDDLNNLVDSASYQDIRDRFSSLRYEGMFTPPTEKGTLIFPGYDGGGEWGGGAFDPNTEMFYVNANEMAWVLNLVKERKEKKVVKTNLEAGKILYSNHCMRCHGPDLQGGGDYPGITEVKSKYTLPGFIELVTTGRRMMPGFSHLTNQEKNAIASFVLNISSEQKKSYKGDMNKLTDDSVVNYTFTGYNKFLTKEGYPAISPPWGTLTAVDLSTGLHKWQIPFGEYEEFKSKGISATGRENYGGPVVTAGGVIFIGATDDAKFRAFNAKDGKVLYETDLPATGFATPSVYSVNGRQYVVIAAGGSKWGGKKSDAYVAFALPVGK